MKGLFTPAILLIWVGQLGLTDLAARGVVPGPFAMLGLSLTVIMIWAIGRNELRAQHLKGLRELRRLIRKF